MDRSALSSLQASEAVILVGGLGTRLRSAVPDLPKPMAPVNGRPFLEILLDYLEGQGIARAILSVGYRASAIRRHFGRCYRSISIEYAEESSPLGTGGAIANALGQALQDIVFVLNGDTFVEVDLRGMLERLRAAEEPPTDIAVAIHEVPETRGYGAVRLVGDRIAAFWPEGPAGPGLINSGVYVINRRLLERYRVPEAFSFEVDFLRRYVTELAPLAFVTTGVFIDIGVPESYARADEILLHLTGRPGKATR